MKACLALIILLITFSAFAGEFYCQHEGKPFLRATEQAQGLKVVAYGEFAGDFGDETHPFYYLFAPRTSRGQYQGYVEGSEHHVWIYELRFSKNPGKHFKAWLNVAHDELGPDHSFELNCVRTASPLAHTVTGVVTEVVCGEIHPFEVGDACIVYIQEDQDLIGLVSDFDASATLEVLKNKKVSVGSHALRAVSKAEAQVLNADINAKALHVHLDDVALLIVH